MLAPAAPSTGLLRIEHGVHRAVALMVAPLWVPLVPLWLRYVRGYRIEGLEVLRAEFRRIRAQAGRPLLVCANHLTLIDSFLVAWALASPWDYLRHFDSMAWNVPERRNFAAGVGSRIFSFLAKCIPVTRGGERSAVANVLNRLVYLLDRGEVALIFPEGGRSRSGRVDPDSVAWGVGRIIGSLPACQVMCVYLRGDSQQTWGAMPERGDRIRVQLAILEPKTDARGARRSRELARQIIAQLERMETRYFDDRQ